MTARAAGTVDVGGDLTANRMGFGAMRLTGKGIWAGPPDRDEAKRVPRRAVELEVRFVDTADPNCPEVSDGLIVEALSLRSLRWGAIRAMGDNAVVGRIAERHDATPTRVALAWLVARWPAVLPIPGTSWVAHLEENVAAAGLERSTEEIAALRA